MSNDKNTGAIVMTVSIILMFAFLALSDGWLAGVDYFTQLMVTLKIQLFKDEDAYNAYLIDIPTKYMILLCVISFSAGLLLNRGILRLPKKLAKEKPDGV